MNRLFKKTIIATLALIFTLFCATPTFADDGMAKMEPMGENIVATSDQTIEKTVKFVNTTGEEIVDIYARVAPYVLPSVEKDYVDYETTWDHYNDLVSWITIGELPNTLGVDESIDIPYTITIPSCAGSDYQWAVIVVNYKLASQVYSGIAAELGVGETIKMTIDNNDASLCDGTVDDPYPYITVKEQDDSGNTIEYTYRYNSEEYAKYQKEHRQNSPATCLGDDQSCQEPAMNGGVVYVVLGIIVSAIAISAIILLIIKYTAKKKTQPTPPPSPQVPHSPQQ